VVETAAQFLEHHRRLDERLSEVTLDDRDITVLKPLDLIPVLCTPGLALGAAALGLAAEEAADN